ncbi:MAG: heme exporter protein CcmD [Hydrogenophaga sp.]|jgi:heme exporter protein D|nr:heme exporter protein CcmD [Hydrogenophaga sp.]
MEWASWSDFWNMGGRGFFVWSAYGVTAICVLTEIVWLRRSAKQSRQRLVRMQQWDTSSEGSEP